MDNIKDIKDYSERTENQNYVAIEIMRNGQKFFKILEYDGDILPQAFKVAIDSIQEQNGLDLLEFVDYKKNG